MQVDKIVLTLRYSREPVDGSLRRTQDVAWKSVEVGAEAVPSEDRNWQEQQRELYAELACLCRGRQAGQLGLLFNNRGKPATDAGPQP